MSKTKVLIDTNVLVYAIDEESIFFNKSYNLLLDNNYVLFTTSKNISEFLAVVTRGNHSLPIEDAIDAVRNINLFVDILFPSPASYTDFMNLLTTYKYKGLQIHDLEIASIAISNNIFNIATFNRDDFKNIKEIHLVKI